MSLRKQADFETKTAKLASPFGLSWAVKLFGQEAVDALPKFQGGLDAGKPRGWVIWRRCTEAGFSGYFQRGYEVGQYADAWIAETRDASSESAISGPWLGRVQPLAAPWSRGVFFDSGRQRRAETEAWQQQAAVAAGQNINA